MVEELTTFRTELERWVARGITVACPWPIARGEGAFLYTEDGREIIDFTSGIAVMSVGHAHPKVTRAVQEAAARFTHTWFLAHGYESYPALARRLIERLPARDASGAGLRWKAAFFTTGAEAVENALKIARRATGRSAFLCFEHAFHGRTYGALSLTSKPKAYRAGVGPFLPEVAQLPFPSRYRCAGCPGAAAGCDCTATTLARIEQLLVTRVPPEEVAAVFIEPIVGEGGFYVPPDDFLPALRALCDRHGILLVADEVQTGIGRTGTFFRFEASGIAPDMVLTAKALAAGMPLSGVLGRAELLDSVPPGGLGGTYAGNPLAIAAAHAVLDIVAEENLCEAAAARGEEALAELRGWQREWPGIGDVRGAGLMLALEFVKDPVTKEPDAALAGRLVARGYENGIALLTAGTYSNCVRLLPPLNIPPEVLREGLRRLRATIGECVADNA